MTKKIFLIIILPLILIFSSFLIYKKTKVEAKSEPQLNFGVQQNEKIKSKTVSKTQTFTKRVPESLNWSVMSPNQIQIIYTLIDENTGKYIYDSVVVPLPQSLIDLINNN